MKNPTIDIHGFTYEKAAIVEWIEKWHGQSPITREKLKVQDLKPNQMMKDMIDKIIAKRGQAIQDAEQARLNEIQRLAQLQLEMERQAQLDKEAAEKLAKEKIAAHGELVASMSSDDPERIKMAVLRCHACGLSNELRHLIEKAKEIEQQLRATIKSQKDALKECQTHLDNDDMESLLKSMKRIEIELDLGSVPSCEKTWKQFEDAREEWFDRKTAAIESHRKLNEGMLIAKGLAETRSKAKVNKLLKKRTLQKGKMRRRSTARARPMDHMEDDDVMDDEEVLKKKKATEALVEQAAADAKAAAKGLELLKAQEAKEREARKAAHEAHEAKVRLKKQAIAKAIADAKAQDAADAQALLDAMPTDHHVDKLLKQRSKSSKKIRRRSTARARPIDDGDEIVKEYGSKSKVLVKQQLEKEARAILDAQVVAAQEKLELQVAAEKQAIVDAKIAAKMEEEKFAAQAKAKGVAKIVADKKNSLMAVPMDAGVDKLLEERSLKAGGSFRRKKSMRVKSSNEI